MKSTTTTTNHNTGRPQFLTRAELIQILSISRGTLARLERAGEFPPRRQLAPRRVGWLWEEVFRWLETRPSVLPNTTPK